MSYYDNQESVANIYVGLVERGWKCYGYYADQSDSMTDYWSPARWDGIATKNGFVLLVDVYGTSDSGRKITKQGYTPDYSKIEKLRATINDKAASQNEKETSQKIIDSMMNKQKESTIIVSEYPTFSQGNPKGCNWHIEKDGNIIAKGKGAYQCDGYLFNSYKEETMKKVNTFIDKIESKIAGMEQLEEVQEKVITKIIKPVEVKTELNNFVKDQTIIKLNSSFTGGHYKGELLQLVYIHTWEKNGESFTSYQFCKLGKKYQQLKLHGAANNSLTLNSKNLEKWLTDGSILTMELQEVEEVTFKTVFKKVTRKGQKDNLLQGEVSETVEEVKTESNTIKSTNENNITVEINYNTEKNGIELEFSGIPSEGTRQLLKDNGFKWSKFAKVWYIKQCDKTILFSESFVSAFNDTVLESEDTTPVMENNETIEPVEVVTMDSEQVETVEEVTTQSEQIETPVSESEQPETNPYNNDVQITPAGYYCHFKAWYFELEQITELLEDHSIPFYETGEKFFFKGITQHQFEMVQMINRENGSILFDDSFEYKEPEQNQHPKKDNVIDFNSRLKVKQQQKETESMTNHFLENILPYMDQSEIHELQSAYKTNDETKLNSIWQKLMLSTAVKRATDEILKEN